MTGKTKTVEIDEEAFRRLVEISLQKQISPEEAAVIILEAEFKRIKALKDAKKNG
jgi:hypothetical protein